jgi:uncharacterized OB-fold protein
VKVLCPACERLAPLEQYTLEAGVLVVTCARCGVATRAVAEQSSPGAVPVVAVAGQGDEHSATARSTMPSGAPTLAPPRVSLASTPGASNVVVLRTAGHEAVQKAAQAADEGPFKVPEGVCPKCLATRAPERETCPHCGIDFARFEEATVLPPQWLRDAWVELLRDWGNEKLHGQLRRKAQQADALPSIGRLYRIRQAWVPEDPIAEEGRADILRLASMNIAFRAPPVEDDRRRKLIIGGVAAVCFGFLLYLVVQVFRGG